MTTLSRLEKFNIISSFTLSSDDISCLILLYQPLIGPSAVSLYMTLNTLLERSKLESATYDHTFICDLANITIEVFVRDRVILEGIGLLSTYKNDDEYLYVLCEPQSPKSFFNDGVLGVYLYQKIGQDYFNMIKNHFKIKKINKQNYLNITASFDDVFESNIPNQNTTENDTYLVGKKNVKKLKINNFDFDFDEFLADIDSSLIETGITETFKNRIVETAQVYSFNEGDMASLFNESLGLNGYFDYKILKKKAKVLFTYKNNVDLPELMVKDKINFDENLKQIENATGEEFLSTLLQDAYSPSDLHILNELNNTLKLNPSVIRIMIMYVISITTEKNDGRRELPPISYFKKVADDWITNGITDVYTAYNKFILKNDIEKPKKTYQRKKVPVRKKDKYEEENSNKDIMEGMEVL